MRIYKATRVFTVFTGMCIVLSAPAFAQGMGGGGGMGGPPPGGKRPSGDGQASDAPPERPAPAPISLAQRLTGVVIIAGQGRKATHLTLTSTKPDVSVVYVTRGGWFEMNDLNLISSAQAGLVDDTRKIGINSALLVNEGARAVMTGGTISTTGLGGNAIYAGSDGAQIKLDGTKITTHGSGAFGIQLADRATLDATTITLATESDHATAISVGNGGRAMLRGGQFTTAGQTSPVLESAGMIEASDITGRADRSDALLITGRGAVRLINSRLRADGYGARIYTAPDAEPLTPMAGPDGDRMGAPPMGRGEPGGERKGGGTPGEKTRPHAPDRDSKTPDIKTPGINNQGVENRPPSQGMGPVTDSALSLTGGQLSAREAVFYVSNIQTRITLEGVDLHSDSGVLVKSAAAAWGPLGQNGGDVIIDGHNQVLTGDCFTDVISHIALDLRDGSHLTGKTTRNTDVSLDASSTWDLTADTAVGKLAIEGVTSPDQIRNIVSHGHTLTYDKKRNPWLNKQSYTLADGGQLVPGL